MSKTHTVKNFSDILDLKPQTAVDKPQTAVDKLLAHQAKSVNARTFDPIDFVKSTISGERARLHIFRSFAWRADNSLINQLRSVYFAVLRSIQAEKHAPDTTIDRESEFRNALDEVKARERDLHAFGLEQQVGPASLRLLDWLRVDFHGAIFEIDNNYMLPSIGQRLATEKARALNGEDHAKLRLFAEHMVKGGKLKVDEAYQELLRREDILAADRFESSRKQLPQVLEVYDAICDGSEPEEGFAALPLETRVQLIEQLRVTIDGVLSELMRDRRASVPNFLTAREEVPAALAMIDQVLATLTPGDALQQQVDRDDAKNAGRTWRDASFVKSAQRKAIVEQRSTH